MSSKNKTLVYYDPNSITNNTSSDLSGLLSQYFDIEKFSTNKVYDPRHTLVIIPYVGAGEWAFDLHHKGCHVVVDNLWEPTSRYLASPGYERLNATRVHQVRSDLWFWYKQATHHAWLASKDHQVYVPNRTYKKLALMPLRLPHEHRQQLLDVVRPHLDDFYYSYNHQGITLPWDIDATDPLHPSYCDTRWYDDTWFSIVSETCVDQHNETVWMNNTPYLGPWPFMTEKTFKPIQFQHPFQIHGQSGLLARLHSLGFETFSEIFDESYDLPTADKLRILKNNVANFDTSAGAHSALTLQKVQHNYALFTNNDLIQKGLLHDIVHPLVHYAEQI